MEAFDAFSYKEKKGDFNSSDEQFLMNLLRSEDAPETLLDIGCGDGVLTRKIKSILPQTSITAIDNSPEQIELASREPVEGVEFVCKDIVDFSSEKKFDCIFSFYAFPHMPKSQILPALKKVRECLKEDASFHLFTNIALFETANVPKEDQEACGITFLDNWPSQINLISLSEMEGLFAESGFEIVSDKMLETGAKVKDYGDMISWQFTLK